MKRIYGDDLKKIQLSILDAVAEFCDANDIAYWIDCGTLLGAIRHKGYIPWDDDIDIGMLRPDYERFMQLFNDPSGKYRFCSIETDPDFYFAHGKVLDTDTVLYEPDKTGYKLCINVDIFVYDNVPDANTASKMYDIRDRHRRFHERRTLPGKPTGNIVRRCLAKCLHIAIKLLPKNYFIKKLSNNAKRYAHHNTPYVGNFTSFARMLCEKDVFDSFTTTEFEGKFYKIPVGYDRWLKAFYGDYMQLPPEDKRVSHHSFEAYVNE